MKKLFAAVLTSAALCTPMAAVAQPEVPGYTLAAMGCMKLRECTAGVYELRGVDQLIESLKNEEFEDHRFEINNILRHLTKVGVKVYIAEGRNFPSTHRGSYYTDTNTFFLNMDYVWDTEVFMKVFRHEAWHAAQDCMAGTIDNSMIAVIHLPDDVPQQYQLDAEIRYGMFDPKAVPWEQEAIWAGNTPGMTESAMEACSSGEMWRVYDPTPKTEEWLRANGYM